MLKTYIIGHKNPDTDSIASACALAELKKLINPDEQFIAASCGNANNQTKYIFQRAEYNLPPVIRDVYPKVSDIMSTQVVSVRADDPVLDIFNKMESQKIRVVPVVEEHNHIKGLVGETELIRLFIQDAVDQRPIYNFDTQHIPRAIKGQIIHKGEKDTFRAAIMVGAMPKAQVGERFNRAGAGQTILVVGNRTKLIESAVNQNVPAIIITGVDGCSIEADFSDYKGWVFTSGLDSAETIRRVILAAPIKTIMNTDIITVAEGEYVETVKDIMQTNRQRLLPIESDGKLTGILTHSTMLRKFKNRVIMVDHNEPSQAVDGIETAELVEIVDHHRLGTVKTNSPVTFYAKPVGSTCTLVHQLWQAAGKKISKQIAMLLMGGILSDTVIMKSPTATQDDKDALEYLSKIAGVDWKEYGLDIFSATDSLKTRTAESIVTTDFKKYSEYGVSFGVGQVEVVTLAELDETVDSLMHELKTQKDINNLDWALLLVTDIIKEESVLLCTPFPAAEKHLNYRSIGDNKFSLPGVLSRKKQLLPEILRILEDFQ